MTRFKTQQPMPETAPTPEADALWLRLMKACKDSGIAPTQANLPFELLTNFRALEAERDAAIRERDNFKEEADSTYRAYMRAMQADADENGFYEHLIICSADRRKPAGTGSGCVCMKGNYTKLHPIYAERDEAIRERDSLKAEQLTWPQRYNRADMESIRAERDEAIRERDEALESARNSDHRAHRRLTDLAEMRAERDALASQVGALLADKARLDWLIKQGPPGAAEGAGLNQEAWDLAYSIESPEDRDNADNICIRAALDTAASGQKEAK